jgi:carbonic anhydrase
MQWRYVEFSLFQRLIGESMRNHFRLFVAFVIVAFCGSAVSAEEIPVVKPAEALQRLKDGNRRFITDHLEKAAGKERLVELAKGQRPIATVIACADSRVSPELIFNLGLGELFVLRVAGNVSVDAHAIVGSAEYAVAHLHVPLVVVIGHENCGAVKASLKGDPMGGNLGRLLNEVQVGNNLNLVAAVRSNVIFQADQLMLESDLLRDFVVSGRIIVVPAVYSLNTGEVTFMDPVKWVEDKKPAKMVSPTATSMK